MLAPMNALAYFCVWVSYSVNSVNINPHHSNSVSCSTTVNSLITNQDYFSVDEINEIADSLLKNKQQIVLPNPIRLAVLAIVSEIKGSFKNSIGHFVDQQYNITVNGAKRQSGISGDYLESWANCFINFLP